MNVPANLLYTEDHEWIRVEGDVAYVGITDYAQEQLGDIVFVEIETECEELAKGEVFGTIEAVKTVSDMFMPVSGTVAEINPEIESNPDVVNKDPYGMGWMIKITGVNQDDLNGLMKADAYQASLG